jgi:hypothetical protein
MRILFILLLCLFPSFANAQATDTRSEAEKERLRQQAEAWRQEKQRLQDVFRPLLAASNLQAKASYELKAASLWLTGGGRPNRYSTLYIRVNSDDRGQILLSALVAVRELIEAGNLDHVEMNAFGSWYTPGIGILGIRPTVHVLWTRLFDYDDWLVLVAPRLPNQQEIAVAQTMRAVLPVDHRLVEGPPSYFQNKYAWENQQVADTLHISAPEVATARRTMLHNELMTVDVCVKPRRWPDNVACEPCRPEDVTIDPVAIRKPDRFPNAAQALADFCKGEHEREEFGHPTYCKVGLPY